MEHNIDVMEGTRFPLCVTLKDGEGNALAGDGFRVYGGAVCPGMAAVAFPVTRSGGEFVVMVPGLAVGRMPWRYQVFVVEQATGVEWLLVSGEVRPEARCADASGGVAAGSLTVTGVLDKHTLSMGVQLGESTELCRSLVARAEEAARRAEEAAAGASFTLTVEEVQKVVPVKWEGDMAPCFAAGYRSLALGSAAKVSGDGGLAVGDSAQVSYIQGTAVGYQASALASMSTAVGSSAKAEGKDAAALGSNATARGSSSVAVGVWSTAGGGSSVAVGDGANSEAYASITVGSGSWAGGSYNVAIGLDARTLNEKAVAVGAQTKADGDCAVALGGDARAWSTHTMALGGGARANDFYSFSVGAEAEANGSSSAAIGIGAKADRSGALVISASNRAAQTRLSLALVAGAATGGSGSVCGIDDFMDGDVIFTCRDDLSGLEHSVQFALYDFVRFLESIPGSIVRVGVVESGDIYGYGYGY